MEGKSGKIKSTREIIGPIFWIKVGRIIHCDVLCTVAVLGKETADISDLLGISLPTGDRKLDSTKTI